MYTKKQRRKIYTKALEKLVRYDKDAPFMCHLLVAAIDPKLSYTRFTQYDLVEMFPEWGSIKPNIGEDCCWNTPGETAIQMFDEDFVPIRETVFCLAIELTYE